MTGRCSGRTDDREVTGVTGEGGGLTRTGGTVEVGGGLMIGHEVRVDKDRI
jgi:hypothetical protein